MKTPKYFICPMSKQIVDSVIELQSDRFGLLPTRRQIDVDGGYVNGWDTTSFYEYVRNKSDIVLERDHSGPNQGKIEDDGLLSYINDAKYFDIIHIDPWKITGNDKKIGITQTLDTINYLCHINPNLKYEILTEEAIIRIEDFELDSILTFLNDNLKEEIFFNIEFVVIQSGVRLDLVNMKNSGHFNLQRLKSMVDICKRFNKKTKEHNGDYLTNEELEIRFDSGVDSLNIGPEIAQIQTLTYLEHMDEQQIDEFYEICLNSKKWEKWVKSDFDINDKYKLIQVCGHYCYNLYELPNIDSNIKEKIQFKLNSLP
jgi:hypothetical protein